MRYTKTALLIFGLGLALGLVVVIGEVTELGYLASALMALGIVGLPFALVADGRASVLQRVAARFARRKRRQRATLRSPAARNPPRRRPAARASRRRRR